MKHIGEHDLYHIQDLEPLGGDQISDNETEWVGRATLPREGLESIEWAKKTG